MRFCRVVIVTGVLSVGSLAISATQSQYALAESNNAYLAAHQKEARASLHHRDPLVDSVVSQLEQQAKDSVEHDGSLGSASSAALREEIRSLRLEKDTLEQQHVALVKQLREMRVEVQKARKAPDSALLLTELDEEKRTRRSLELQLETAREKLSEQAKHISQANSTQDGAFSELEACKLEIQRNERIVSKLPEIHEKFYALKDDLGKSQTALDQCGAELKQAKAELPQIASLESAVSKTQKALTSCEATNATQSKELESLGMLKQQLIATKNELLMQETELKVLRGAADPKKLAAIADAKQSLAPEAAKKSALPQAAQPVVTSDMLIVEVTGSKTNLRSGPGTEHSPVMQVQGGTRLTVEAKQGDWYRIFTPTGSRAYVSADVVQELGGAELQATPTSTANKPVANAKRSKAEKEYARQAADAEKLQRAAGDDALVPFGVVNLSSKAPEARAEKRALQVLKSGVGRPNSAPVPPADGE